MSWTKHTWALDGGKTLARDVEWKREYLGQWVEPAPGPFTHAIGVDYGTEPSVAMTATTCALCSTVLYTGPVDDDLAERLEQAHREGCERRPVEVGDWVRLELPFGEFIDGPVTTTCDPDGHHAMIPTRSTPKFRRRLGNQTPYTFRPGPGVGVRRIPRPEQTVRANPALWPGNVPPILADAEPELYDGLTRKQCLERWQLAQREDGDPDDPWEIARIELTPAQLAAAREEWSAQLRAKVQAKAERERCAVTYCEVDPWE